MYENSELGMVPRKITVFLFYYYRKRNILSFTLHIALTALRKTDFAPRKYIYFTYTVIANIVLVACIDQPLFV